MTKSKIFETSKIPTVNIILDTLKKNKQALVFVNSKRSAEKTAEDISKALSETTELRKLAYELETALPRPTTQCKKLSEYAKKGVVFHHAGLVSKQRELIEDKFRTGEIKIICCTPSLAIGVDTPAFRTIIKDLRRYTGGGMDLIPVMEYHQMAGRAGRPGKETFGEAIIICSSEKERDLAVEKFIFGQPEEILSKLAVEPVLRTYLLSLISTDFVKSHKEIFEFFSKTFWAHQYEDLDRIKEIIMRMLKDLELWGFIEINARDKNIKNDSKEEKLKTDFVSALKLKLSKVPEQNSQISATLIGKRVAELYLDPLTAHEIMNDLKKAETKELRELTFLFSICKTSEMNPKLKVKTKDYDITSLNLEKYMASIIDDIPAEYEEDYSDFLSIFKTSYMLKQWLDERDEEEILEQFDIRPGELHVKINDADWLLYSCEELCRMMNIKDLLKEISKVRLRLKYGVKEELLTLLKLKNVGRIRARRLFNSGLTDIGKIKKSNINELARIVGPNLAINIKEQLGEEVVEKIIEKEEKENKKGQHSLLDY